MNTKICTKTQTIYKYPLELMDFQEVDMPQGAIILSVDVQPAPIGSKHKEQIVLWAITKPDQPLIPRRIRIYGTGNPLQFEHQLRFIGTVQMYNHSLVWHVFENAI